VRRTKRYRVEKVNSLWQMYRTVSFWKIVRNYLVISISKITPWVQVKRWLYIYLLGMKVGKHTSFAFQAMPDLMFPELISVGDNSIIGYNVTILCHEYLIEEYRLGEVEIGSNVMIGANSLILPGIRIGDGAVIGAGSVVVHDVDPFTFVAGNPAKVIKTFTKG